MSNGIANVIQAGIQKAVAAAELQLTPETFDELVGTILGKFTKPVTGKVLLRVAVLTDGLRVVLDTYLRDGKISNKKVVSAKMFIGAVANYLSEVRPDSYSFSRFSESDILPFIKQYRNDTGLFGYKNEVTLWAGLKICANIANKTGDDTAYKILRDTLLQEAKELMSADGEEEKEKQYSEKLQKELNKSF